jgi:hypothetical protein
MSEGSRRVELPVCSLRGSSVYSGPRGDESPGLLHPSERAGVPPFTGLQRALRGGSGALMCCGVGGIPTTSERVFLTTRRSSSVGIGVAASCRVQDCAALIVQFLHRLVGRVRHEGKGTNFPREKAQRGGRAHYAASRRVLKKTAEYCPSCAFL